MYDRFQAVSGKDRLVISEGRVRFPLPCEIELIQENSVIL